MFVIQPLLGLQEILAGGALAGPELVQATASAASQAVRRHLRPDGLARVEQGGALLLAGAMRLTAILALAVGFWIFWHPTVLCLASAAWVLAICLVAG